MISPVIRWVGIFGSKNREKWEKAHNTLHIPGGEYIEQIAEASKNGKSTK